MRDLSSLARGQEARAVIASPEPKVRGEVLRYAMGACPWPILSSNQDGFRLLRPDGRIVSVEAVVSSAGGTALRGRALTDAFFDECAFFRDKNSVVNDDELFKAASPRVLPGGQIIIASTPWNRAGLLWEFYRDCWNKPGGAAVVAHAPTLTLRDTPETRAVIERERKRDPDNAAREYDAVFPSTQAHQFFSDDVVDAAIQESTFPELSPGEKVTVGADFGFERDSSAMAVCIADRDGRLRVAELDEQMPADGAPLKPSVVCRRFSEIALRYKATEIMADQHYRQAIAEYVEAAGLDFVNAPSGQKAIAESYVRLRSLMREGRVALPAHPRLIAQLKAVVAKPLPGGGMSIQSPRLAKGGHGDLVSALVLAVWKAVETTVPTPAPRPGTHAAFEAEAMRIEANMERQQAGDGPAWAKTFTGDRNAWRSRYNK